MRGFRDRLRSAISNSEFYADNVFKLSKDAGLGEKTVYNILRDDALDISKTGPGIFGLARVSRLLNVSLDYLAGNSAPAIREAEPGEMSNLSDHVRNNMSAQSLEARKGPSSDILLRTYVKSGGRIEAFTQWMECCDQYEVPGIDSEGIKVIRVGQKSLSALTMGESSTSLLQAALDDVPAPDLQESWLKAYRTAGEDGTLTTLETLDVQMPNHPVRVKMDFIRTLLRVADKDNKASILNFSFLVV
ncbi:hypothetical protein J7426_14425 [Tropicibacter sp. R16_0]|uniref:hypothetical protein n=1 Tax=Tropicibacter sp. R16_0 TaxID=2821102 RepID=UPI001ADAE99B|nr:hypothetical protein [Tropicibacter sp. R16_0]MBO9451466.1 hypothetical protein [Tropicibacter sp. R16_0]